MIQAKTNVMRLLEQQGIPYIEHFNQAKKNRNNIFKTLVTVSKSGEHYVFMIPVNEELDLKKGAKAVNEKSISMIKEKELLPLTGYVHGGCSPIGMKKAFKTVLNASAAEFDSILFSAGKVGVSVEMNPNDLSKMIDVSYADVIKDN